MHIHSALSACCADEMSPRMILDMASKRNLNVISITDHNAVQHSIAACQLSKKDPIAVIPGVELTTREEVHLLAYFPDAESLLKLEKKLDSCLPKASNNPEIFGHQVSYDLNGEIVEIDNKLRQTALNIGLDNLVDFIHDLGGLAVPAHIDKDRFSMLSQLGFLDPEANFDAVEISKFKWEKESFHLADAWEGFPVIAGSDSHAIDDIGLFFMEDINEEIRDFTSLKDFFEKNKQ
ncbi:PHP domain-containing protein [bacterium]|nr:PHP domain-containing protein [bacterium]